ncbi:hypothetical protein F0357_04975 [Rhizobiales bacterium Sp-1]|uniref:Uncharacterized protein n=1 Tax=Segnochrobactrum spirostomi TaxID=2608987 RepID=A0A6A7XZ19_9HYPH|nr:hypothetical protein [Segnochrobactrum spirostomi]
MARRGKTLSAFQPGRGYTKEDWDDVDSPELTDEELATGRPFAEAFPELAATIRRRRAARGPSEPPDGV